MKARLIKRPQAKAFRGAISIMYRIGVGGTIDAPLSGTDVVAVVVSTGAKWGGCSPALGFSPRGEFGALKVSSICWIPSS